MSVDEKYRRVEDRYECRKCSATILGKSQARSLHTRLIPGSGFGEVRTVVVPYCPNCEEEPPASGSPIYYEDEGIW